MEQGAARALLADVLGGIAPEVDLDTVEPDAPLRDEADLDSISFLDLVTGLAGRTGLDIPESDYDRLSTVTAVVDYLAARAP